MAFGSGGVERAPVVERGSAGAGSRGSAQVAPAEFCCDEEFARPLRGPERPLCGGLSGLSAHQRLRLWTPNKGWGAGRMASWLASGRPLVRSRDETPLPKPELYARINASWPAGPSPPQLSPAKAPVRICFGAAGAPYAGGNPLRGSPFAPCPRPLTLSR